MLLHRPVLIQEGAVRMSRITLAAVAAMVYMLAPAAVSAQQPSPEVREPSPEVQELLVERQQLTVRLGALQEQALENDELRAQQTAVSDAVRGAMIEADPTMQEKLDRIEAIMEEARAAQGTGDMERIAALTAEAETLQPQIQEAQATALARPEIEQQVDAFQLALRTRMVELDPQAAELLDRLDELNRRIQAEIDAA
jgi:chromosome segregation ATPase